MSFYFPLGLLGLIGIPILIIIFLIKSKYTEQTIASTYLWELSERFLKKRKPISKLTGIITLILQILVVTCASLLIAHPVFTLPDSANDFYFILDGSASMNMTDGSATRFERAQSEINRIIDDSRSGSSYTLIFASDATNVSFESVKDRDQAKIYVNALSAGWNATDCSSAMTLAQEYFDRNPSAEIYLVTDKAYETENMTLLNVSSGEQNYAFLSYGYSLTALGVESTGEIVSYSADRDLAVELYYIAEMGEEPVKMAETKVSATAGEPCAFTVSAEGKGFAALELRISDGDALAEDNSVFLYDEAKTQQRQVLIVNGAKDMPYIYNAMVDIGRATVKVVEGAKYTPETANGYGMYIFNGYVPAELPKNAAIWLIDAIDGTGKGAGISFRDYEEPRDSEGENSYFTPTYTKSTTAQAKLFTKDLIKRDVAVRKYAKYGVPRSYTTVLSNGSDPLVAAGLNENNDRQVVFAFRIGDSNFGLTDDFLILVKNLMDYSFPSVIEDTVYNCGDVMNINVVSGCEEIIVTMPSQNTTTLDTQDSDICELQLSETGTYKLEVKIAGNATNTVLYAYACVPEAESRNEDGGELKISGTKEYNFSDGYYDELLAFFIAIALLLLAEWGVYCYEQYQLR